MFYSHFSTVLACAALLLVSACGNGVSSEPIPVPTAPTSTAYKVSLNWDAPTSSADPVVGYHVYRTLSGDSAYQLVNSTADTLTSYLDSTVVNGTAYDYLVKSVDASGVESVPSNVITVNIPSSAPNVLLNSQADLLIAVIRN
jgi:fibronectin type 3 domain-containing protein